MRNDGLRQPISSWVASAPMHQMNKNKSVLLSIPCSSALRRWVHVQSRESLKGGKKKSEIHWTLRWPDEILSEILGSEIVELLRDEFYKFSGIPLAFQNLFRILRQPVPKLQSNHWSIMGHFRNYHFARLGVKGIPWRKYERLCFFRS